VKTLGVDLASSAARTATCVVEWADCSACIRQLVVGADDDAIVSLATDVDAVGIDAPFGWPAPFVELVSGKTQQEAWTSKRRDELRFRATDHHVHRETGRWPLSVSSDLIGVVAMRCHGLRERLRLVDPAAWERTMEVYPAAALRRWGLVDGSYKGKDRLAGLGQLVDRMLATAPWLDLRGEQQALLRRSDDAFDALVGSLVARAAKVGLADAPSEDPVALSEGWIVLPKAGALAAIAR
jgi:predicted nuclease with RNAse H fold